MKVCHLIHISYLLPPCFILLIFLLQNQHASGLNYYDNPSLNRPRIVAGAEQQQQQPQFDVGGAASVNNNPFYLQPQQPQQTQQFGGNFPNPQQQKSPTTSTNGIGGVPFGTGLLNGQQQQQQRQLDQSEFGRQLQRRNSTLATSSNGGIGSGGILHNSGSSMANPSSSSGNVLVEVNIRSFANPGFRLPDNRLCACPQGTAERERCLQASPQRNGYNCLTSLSLFVLSADSDLKFAETPYLPLNQNGQLDRFVPYEFHLDSPPSAIGVLVHNLGPQINADGTLQDTNTVTTLDRFIHHLAGGGGTKSGAAADGGSGIAGGGGVAFGLASSFGGGGAGGSWAAAALPQQPQTVTLQGHMLGTQLSLSYSVSCQGERGADGKLLIGPGCDLSCNTSSATANTAICVSQRSGYYSQCRWTAGNSQVTNCQNCPWGIKEDAYCADAQGGVLKPDHAGVVSSFYYTAFEVVCVVCAFLLILLLLLAMLAISRRNAKNRRGGTRTPGSSNRGAAPFLRRETEPIGGGGGAAATAAGFVQRGEPQAVPLNSAAATAGYFRLDNATPTLGNKPPPPYTIQATGGGGTAGNAIASTPHAVPRSNASTASAGGSSISGSGGGGNSSLLTAGSGAGAGNSRRRFPPPTFPPLVVSSNGGGTARSGKALSPPRYQPLPHLGPLAAGVADGGAGSLNTSFAGSQTAGVPLPPPSVSADV